MSAPSDTVAISANLAAGATSGRSLASDGSKITGEELEEARWTEGMIGIAQMGTGKTSREDWRDFHSLVRSGVPMAYR